MIPCKRNLQKRQIYKFRKLSYQLPRDEDGYERHLGVTEMFQNKMFLWLYTLCTENYWILHLQWVNVMVCKISLNTDIFKTQYNYSTSLFSSRPIPPYRLPLKYIES